jgi:hypothetical protein
MSATPFVFLRAQPDRARGESLNVGLVVFLKEGPRVYLDCPPWRLRALHPDLEHIDLVQWSNELEICLKEFTDQRSQLDWLCNGMGAIRADQAMGHVHVPNADSVTAIVEDLLERFVHLPERTLSPIQRKTSTNKNRLHSQLRTWFRASRLFSSKLSDLSNHRIIPSYPIDISDDLYADFALKNGAIHIIETLDLRGVEKVTKTVRGEAGLTAILLDQARQHLPGESKRIAVTASDNYSVVKSIVHLVGRYADDVIVIEDPIDRQRLAEFIASSLEVREPLLPKILNTQPEFNF